MKDGSLLWNNTVRKVLSLLVVYGIFIPDVPVAQWIEHRSPEPGALVRFQSGTFLLLELAELLFLCPQSGKPSA